MAETAPGRSNTTDTPDKDTGKKGDAGSMPVKTYPSSTKMATAGKSNTIDGPCTEAGRCGVYHKK